RRRPRPARTRRLPVPRARVLGARAGPRRLRAGVPTAGGRPLRAPTLVHLMARKRVHEIAKEQGVSSKELLARLQAAGIDAKAAASSVDEAAALQALQADGAADGKASGDGAPPAQAAPPPAPPAGGPAAKAAADQASEGPPERPSPRPQRPTRDSLAGERAPGAAAGRRRVVIDSQASR